MTSPAAKTDWKPRPEAQETQQKLHGYKQIINCEARSNRRSNIKPRIS